LRDAKVGVEGAHDRNKKAAFTIHRPPKHLIPQNDRSVDSTSLALTFHRQSRTLVANSSRRRFEIPT
jgi:hypothetical protein